MNKLHLLIDNTPTPFHSASINYSLEQLAHTFNLTIAPQRITSPLPVEFRLNEQTIFIGQIDQIQHSTESASNQMQLSGRSQSANMIDSRITMNALYDLPLNELLNHIATEFGLSVHSELEFEDYDHIDEFQINAESPVENLAQLVKEKGLILIERNGVLTLENTAHASIDGIKLTVGDNLESLSVTRSFNQLYHSFEVQGAWDDSFATETIEDVNPQRKMVIISDQLQTEAACQSRARYERDLALAQTLTVSATVPKLYPELTIDGLNRVIHVQDERQNLSEPLVIKSIELSVDGTHASTRLELIRPFKVTYD